jgi:hypothetical protein
MKKQTEKTNLHNVKQHECWEERIAMNVKGVEPLDALLNAMNRADA